MNDMPPRVPRDPAAARNPRTRGAAEQGQAVSARTGSQVIAIASGKGGVGKTWFAITLAHGLALGGRKVLLFDGDLGLANVDVQLGLTPRWDLGSVITGQVALADAVIRHPDGGFDILAGQSGSGALAILAPDRLEQVLATLARQSAHYDTVLLDLGAGLDRFVRRMAAWADVLLAVVTEEPTSLTDAYALLKLHCADRQPADARIVVNQAATHAAGERTYATLRRACLNFLGLDPALAGTIRRDDHVREAIRRQSLLLTRHPACPAAMDVQAAAEKLARQLSHAA